MASPNESSEWPFGDKDPFVINVDRIARSNKSSDSSGGSSTATLNVDKDLKNWFRSLYPTKVDIVGDFTGKERFAIHGEALLAHCLHTMKVDYASVFDLIRPPPILHTCTHY